jgi:hypothetical protein
MGYLDWKSVRERYTQNPVSHTKRGNPFRVSRVTDTAIYVDLLSGEQYISRANLEQAVHLINEGQRIEGPADYKRLVYDQRPAYAWAILRDMGFVE